MDSYAENECTTGVSAITQDPIEKRRVLSEINNSGGVGCYRDNGMMMAKAKAEQAYCIWQHRRYATEQCLRYAVTEMFSKENLYGGPQIYDYGNCNAYSHSLSTPSIGTLTYEDDDAVSNSSKISFSSFFDNDYTNFAFTTTTAVCHTEESSQKTEEFLGSEHLPVEATATVEFWANHKNEASKLGSLNSDQSIDYFPHPPASGPIGKEMQNGSTKCIKDKDGSSMEYNAFSSNPISIIMEKWVQRVREDPLGIWTQSHYTSVSKFY